MQKGLQGAGGFMGPAFHQVNNGRPAHKIAEMNITQVWVCQHCERDEIDWEVRALSNDPDVLDIVAVKLPDPVDTKARP